MKFSCVKIGKEVVSVVMAGKSIASTKTKTTLSEEERERIISLESEEGLLFYSL